MTTTDLPALPELPAAARQMRSLTDGPNFEPPIEADFENQNTLPAVRVVACPQCAGIGSDATTCSLCSGRRRVPEHLTRTGIGRRETWKVYLRDEIGICSDSRYAIVIVVGKSKRFDGDHGLRPFRDTVGVIQVRGQKVLFSGLSD